MADDKRRSKHGIFSNSLNHNQWERGSGRQEVDILFDRGPAHTSSTSKMTPFDYKYNTTSQHLVVDDHVERPVLFAGVIDNVAAAMDITNRTDVLRIIDKGKKLGVIPMHLRPHDHSAILSLSIYNIKIVKHGTEELLLRIPMHEVAAVCYIKDDKQHLLAIKYGTPEMCQLGVLHCDSKPVAEELCSLVGHCFQLIYIGATISILDQSINPSGNPSTGGSTTIPLNHTPSINGSEVDSTRRVPSEGDNSVTSIGGELLHDYMKKLHKELDAKELKHFAQALQDWHQENLFPEFCERVLLLYGQDRKHLLAEMLPFIPADNLAHFEDFLSRNGIMLAESASTLSSSRSNLHSHSTRRSIGEVSTTSSVSINPTNDDPFNTLLELTESQFNSVTVDMEAATNIPNADYT